MKIELRIRIELPKEEDPEVIDKWVDKTMELSKIPVRYTDYGWELVNEQEIPNETKSHESSGH